jgi:tetratricopeptide (TPR) repeat protein
MTTHSVQFIGRQEELALVDRLLRQPEARIVLCIEGPGGIGKTRLLQEIDQRYRTAPRLTTTGILDFDTPHLRVPGSLNLEIAHCLGEEHFRTYLRKLRDLNQMQRADVSYERLDQETQAVKEAFEACYQALASQQRILILMDTLEDVQDTDVWSDIFELIQCAANTLFILSGRRTKAAWEKLRPILDDDLAQFIELGPLDTQESIAYIQTKEKNLHLSLDSDLRAKLVQVAEGRPILIDLASEWVARDIPVEWLMPGSDKDLTALTKQERRKLEAALVKPIESLPAPLYQAVLHLAYVYPMDGPIMGFLLSTGPEHQPKLFDELNTLAFVKPLPDGSYTLHDEMRRMIDEHIWGDIDPERSRRRQISFQMAKYFDERAARLEGQPAEEAIDDATSLEAFLAQNLLQQQYWTLREQQLFHLLRADLLQGYGLFLKLFEEATLSGYGYQQRSTLLNYVQEFADQLDKEQRYEIDIRQARYWLETGQQDNISKARHLLEQLMSAYADDGERELDILTRLANCHRRSGQLASAAELLEQAREICRRKLPRWAGRIENTLGWHYRMMGALDRARAAYQSALDYASDEKTIAAIYNNLSFVECLRGEYDAALRYCMRARDARDRLGLKWDLATSHATLADIYRHWGRYDEAIAQAHRAIESFELLQDREWLARVYARRGASRRLRATTDDEFNSAVADLQKSLDQNYLPELSYASHVMGCVYWDMGRLDEALSWFAKSDAQIQQRFDIWVHVNNLVGSAEIYFRKWEQEPKPEYRARVLEYASELTQEAAKGYTLAHHTGRMTRVLGDLAYAEGQVDQALEHYALAYSLLGGRYAGYGRRTLHDELSQLARRIDNLLPEQAILWCDYLERAWSDATRDIRNREDLLSMCRIHRTEARLKLAQTPSA